MTLLQRLRAIVWCRKGHDERRLRQSELTADGNYVHGSHDDMVIAASVPIARIRICKLCSRLRAVTPRKKT